MSESRRLIGNIEKRSEGRYRLTVSAGIDHEGKRIRHRRTVMAETDRDAEVKLYEFLVELKHHVHYRPSNITFGECVNLWLNDQNNLAPKTLCGYKSYLNARILPAFAHFAIKRITPQHIIDFENSMRVSGARKDGKSGRLSERTILHHRRILNIVFEEAIIRGFITENPLAALKRRYAPKVENAEISHYNQEEVAAMLKALEDEPLKYQVVVNIALAAGLRLGEIMGLEWPDVDFSNNTIKIVRTSQRIPGETITKAPKSDASKRTISIPEGTMKLIKEYRVKWLESKMKVGDLWEGTERLFIQWNGKPMYPGTPSAWFPKFLERHGLRKIRFHDLRHTSATLLIHSGLDIRSVSARLGHAKTSTTLDVYSHALESGDKKAADFMEQIVSSK